MMNKKAIAAFAAGATLLAGFAMATPAFAADAAKKPTAEQCKNAQDKIDDAKAALATAKANSVLAGDAKTAAHKKLDKATGLVNAYKEALKDVKAKETAYADAEDKDAARSALTQSVKKLNEALKNINDNKGDDKTFPAATAVPGDVTVGAGNGTVTYGTATKDSFKAALEGLATKDADDAAQAAEDKVSAAQDKLDLAEIHLKNLGCKASGSEQNPPQNPPVTPAQPGSKTEAIKNVFAKKVDVDAAEHNFAEKKEAYAKAAATLTAAKAELDAAEHDKAVAAQNLSDFEASGVNDSAKLKSLKEAVARADAHVVRTTTAFNKALADFNDAKTADLAAQAAYNLAKDAYDEAYNAAIKLGVNPALLPSVTAIDPLSPAFPQLAQAQKIYADALAGKFGAAAQKAVQKAEAKAQAAAPAAAAGKAGAAAAAKGELATKGGNGHGGKAGEKLGNAGVGVALTALAASMLAGMGAAVRKMRH
ncbi:hypothetical protein [Gardnerella vaginalis]|uniref:hypothetical protein n=1 Tax=Gardnerella vaginalis TaxID=2702 RepID=UPI0039F0E865